MLSKSPKITQQVVEPELEAHFSLHYITVCKLCLYTGFMGAGGAGEVEYNSCSRTQSESNGGWVRVLENFKAPPDDWGVQHGLGTLMYTRLQPGR